MANYQASARSNYFEVKDAEKFLDWTKTIPGLGVWNKEEFIKKEMPQDEIDKLRRTFGVFGDDGDSGGWPTVWEPSKSDAEVVEPVDIFNALSSHLADGQVCVAIEAGAEKLRYISGYAIAVDNTGKIIEINLNNIYEKAHQVFGVKPTEALY